MALWTQNTFGCTGGNDAEVEQLDFVAPIVLLAFFVAAQVRGQVLFVVVAKYGGDAGVVPLLVGDLERA